MCEEGSILQWQRLKLHRHQILLPCFMHDVKYMLSLNNKNERTPDMNFPSCDHKYTETDQITYNSSRKSQGVLCTNG